MRIVLAVAAAAALTASCSSDPIEEPPPTSPNTTTVSSTLSTVPLTSPGAPPSSVSPSPGAPPAAAAEVAPQPVAPVPATFVRCYLADGTALLSDGTTTYMDTCNESAGGPLLLEDGTSIYDNHPGLTQPPAAAPYPGWHCDGPAYLCRDDNASGKTAGG